MHISTNIFWNCTHAIVLKYSTVSNRTLLVSPILGLRLFLALKDEGTALGGGCGYLLFTTV